MPKKPKKEEANEKALFNVGQKIECFTENGGKATGKAERTMKSDGIWADHSDAGACHEQEVGEGRSRMTAIDYTGHAEMRMRQRGVRKRDILLILECATRIDDDTWFMCERDARRAIEGRKREIQMLERLAGLKAVVRGEHVVTAYHSSPADRKRTLRRGRRSGCAK